jgi:outer membrane receptor protein involved in Fe transport
MTKKMLDATSTGMDVLKLIPGIQVDLMQNISLEGNRNIQVFVDGKERDGSFISQLDPKQIERIEIMSKPSSNYDGNTTGAINIILKKDRNSGISGQVYAEVPTSFSELYIRPNYTLNWGCKKLNLYTSYKGEMTYLDLHESTLRKTWNSSGTSEISSNQYVRQKDWSHRFNFGIDYFISTRDQLDLYAFYNPWSRELDGNADLQLSGSANKVWQARKEDTDMNTGTFYSLYYRHNFKKEGRGIAVEISNYKMKAKNSTAYVSEGNLNSIPVQTNSAEPIQNGVSGKIDYTTRIGNKLDFSTGVKTKFLTLQDSYSPGFQYDEKIIAAYGTLSYQYSKYFLSIGLRAEESVANLKNSFTNPVLSFFPNTTLNYKLTSRQNIQLSYNRSIQRPNIYQLNPRITIDDPYTVSKGNPFLKPELRNSLYLEYSIQFNSSYFASRLFYNKLNDVINNLTFINDTGAFETQVHNMGIIHQFGIQLSGTFRMGFATINPFLQLFDQYTSGNSVAKQYGIENRHNLAYNSGLSAVLSFRHEISLSFVFQYASPKNDIQGNSFSGALYFLSLEKTFKQKIKIGMVCALPFTRSFTYQGSEIDGSGFSSHYEGNVKISNPFCWFKLCYQFNSGRKKEAVQHATEEIDSPPKKGF